MDIPAPAIFLAILLAIPLQMCFSPEKTSDMDFYLKNLLKSVEYYWNKFKVLSEIPENTEETTNALEKREIEEIDPEEITKKGYFGCK